MDSVRFAGRIYPAKSARLALIDEAKDAEFRTGKRSGHAFVRVPASIYDRMIADLEHAVQILDALQDQRDMAMLNPPFAVPRTDEGKPK